MNRKNLAIGLAISCMLVLGSVTAYAAPISSGAPTASLLVSGLQGGSGSTIGPDGALYVTETAAGRILRVDPKTGNVKTFASGLPKRIKPLGGAMDIAFIDKTAYVLVTLVGSDVGGSDVVGIYRVDDLDSFTVIADIGTFSMNHPPNTPFGVPTGVQYAMQPYRGGFLVTDGHLNRVLRVRLDGSVTELIAFGNIVPTGLAVWGNTIYMAEAGPLPHLPQDGKVVSFESKSPTASRWWPPAEGSSSTWSLASVASSTPSRRVSGRGPSLTMQAVRRSRTPARSWRSTGTARSPLSLAV